MSGPASSHPELYVSKIDLSLPAVNTGQGPVTSRDKSSTEAKLLRGFFGNVKFAPWELNEYQSMITSALQELDDVSSPVEKDLRSRLQNVRKTINEDVVHRPLSEKRLKKLKKKVTVDGLNLTTKHNTGEPEIAPLSAVPTKSVPNGPGDGQAYSTTGAREEKKESNADLKDSVKMPRTTDNRMVYGTRTEVDSLTNGLMLDLVLAFNDMFEISHVDEWYRIVTTEQRLPLDYTKFKFSPSSSETNHTTDRSLVRMRGKEQVGASLCSYKYIGPRMDLCYHVIEYGRYIREAESPPRKKLKQDATCKGNEQVREGANDIMLPADVMCDYFNGMFGKVENCDSKTRDVFTSEDKLGPVAQTLSQGLCTQSGCCLLYTHQQAIAFEIYDYDADGKMIVKTSPLVRCSSPRGTVALKLSISYYSLQRAEAEGKLEMLKELSTMIKEAADERDPTRYDVKHQQDKKIAADGGGNGRYEGSKDQRDNSQKKNGNNGDKSAQKNTSCTNVISNPIESNTKKPTPERTLQDVLTEFADSIKRPNLEGGSGFLFYGSANGTRLVTKVWNEKDRRGLLEVMNEIKMYRHIENECPHLLGRSIPRLILAKSEPRRNSRFGGDVYLVMEHVGEILHRASDGTLRFGCGDKYEVLDETDELLIRDAACSSLKGLHDNNLLHGDIAFRNLLVARSSSSGEWRAWWIDLGRATVDFREKSFDKWIAKRDCERLFSTSE